ncbi:hypothetical protein HYFRA_00003759 [Hymenoscyphus fraxineus]|uniref:Amidohydrolase 3 domain-containing protein n=1 Tax=Hymenoscyphus fraxineus TaxID=746836 RepID=A0A9N9PW98_9HELO|nr:hypothetical protein HYFRA_00003759 [Hymenoscyphus fraxineus]
MATIYRNGRFFTGSDKSFAKCIVVQDGLIQYVGDENHPTIEQTKKRDINEIDMLGRTILPGFIDGHMHLMLLGSSLKQLSLERCESLEDIRATIKAYAVTQPSLPRILCRGWMHSMTNGEAFASMIDDLDDRPIFIDSKDLHFTWCNSAALQELGVEDKEDPAGGKIHRDENGKTTGLLSETAAQIFAWPHFANVSSMDQKLEAIEEAITAYTAVGCTGMVEMAMDENVWDVLQVLRSRKYLPFRLAAYWLIQPSSDEEKMISQVDRAIELHRKYNLTTSPNCRIAGIKIICDGVVDACTAALQEPYCNGKDPESLWTPSMLRRIVKHADSSDLQCALHAIGDGAIKMAVDTLEAVCTPGKRHRIEHLEMASPTDAKRLGQLGITASIQPVHSDPAILGAWPKLIGNHRASRAFPYNEFHAGGAVLALGSDSPTAPHDPLVNLYTATTRRSARDLENKSIVNEAAILSLATAISAATKGAAYSCFADAYTGSLEVGKKADFVVLNMEWNPENLLEARVVQTWFEGQKVYAVDS